jgi:hypothetical protein
VVGRRRGGVPKAGGGSKMMTIVATVPPCPITLKAKGIARTSWSQVSPLEYMTKTVKYLDDNTGDAIGSNDEVVTLHSYSVLINISYSTLKSIYLCADKSNFHSLGKYGGRPTLVSKRDHAFIRCVLDCKVQANDGVNMQGKIDLVRYLNQDLSYHQCYHHLRITLLKGNTTIIKLKLVVAHQTNTKRIC